MKLEKVMGDTYVCMVPVINVQECNRHYKNGVMAQRPWGGGGGAKGATPPRRN